MVRAFNMHHVESETEGPDRRARRKRSLLPGSIGIVWVMVIFWVGFSPIALVFRSGCGEVAWAAM